MFLNSMQKRIRVQKGLPLYPESCVEGCDSGDCDHCEKEIFFTRFYNGIRFNLSHGTAMSYIEVEK